MTPFLQKKSLRFWIIICLILTIPTFYQLIRPGFFFMQDDLQAFRVHQMFKCFQDFQIPCRWVPDMGYQYGYPQFLYYPPSVYYLGAFIHLFGIGIIDSVKILFILGLILSTLFMFLFLKSFFEGEIKDSSFFRTTLPAFVGAMLYTFVPYKALEVYVRGALSEFWSLVFFPLIFWAIYELITKQKVKYIIFLSISIGGLMLTHNLMTLIFAPIAIIWTLAILILKKRFGAVIKIIFAGLLGLGLAAFFTLPVIFEGKYVHLETLQGGYFDWRQHFVSLERLFVSNRWGYGSSGLGQDNDLSLSTGQIHAFLGVMGLILSLIFFRKQKNISIIAITFSLIELGVLFLIHQKSSFIWERIPVLWWLQFPWRFLTDSIFLLSFLGASAVFLIVRINKKVALIFSVIILVSILALHSEFFTPKDWKYIGDNEKFSGESWQKQLTISIFDYLPIYAKLPPNRVAPLYPEILDGEASVLSYIKGSNYQRGQLQVGDNATVRLPLFDFPGMAVSIDGKKISHRHDDCRRQDYCLGLIIFSVPAGPHKIEAKLQDTVIRRAGNIITLISIFILALLFFKLRREKYEKDFN